MRQTLIINKKQETELQQILNELVFSLKKTYSEEDLLSLSCQIFKESAKQTYNSKKEITANLISSIAYGSGVAIGFTSSKLKHYKNIGIKNALNEDFTSAKSSLNKIPDNTIKFGQGVKDKAINFNKSFLKKTKNEKIESMSVGLMAVLIFFASAGGGDLEGGIPDSDFNLGIGYHRHFMSHSIIMGFIVEFIMRTGVEIINKSYENLPINHHPFWDKTNAYISKNKKVMIGAMWAGISAHLLKDSGILGHGVKPYNGIPIELSLAKHQGLFAANATASAMFSYRDLKTK